jgi:hypothetical protein
MRVILYTSLYPEKNEIRRNEILKSLRNNLKNNLIDEIRVLNEGFEDELLRNKKIVNISRTERPTFADFSQYLDVNAINIITNNDIWFGNSLKKMKWLFIQKGDLLSLTRVEKDGKLFRQVDGDSQDTWIFKGVPACLKKCNFYMGRLGCDNKLNFIFYEGGFRVLNPSKYIVAHHEHDSNERTYTEEQRIKGAYLLSRPIGFWKYHWFKIQLLLMQRGRINFFTNFE